MALIAFDRDKIHVMGRDVRWAYFRAILAAALAVALFLAACVIAVNVYLVSTRADEIRSSGAKNRDIRAANKRERLTLSTNVPALFALSGGAFVFGIVAFRQYNMAKSEFPR